MFLLNVMLSPTTCDDLLDFNRNSKITNHLPYALVLKLQNHLNAGSKSTVQCKNIVRDVDQLGIRLHKSHPFACFDLAVFNPQEVHQVFGLEQKALPDRITHQAGSDYGVEEDKGLGGECGVEIGRFQIKEG